jgi:NADH-quinone oxidoreductase subunit J
VSLADWAFLGLGIVAVGTAAGALLVRELVHTILWIATFFVALAALYFLLEAPFLGVLQLGVYAGAVTILLLFGVMVTRKRIFSREAATGLRPAPIAAAAVVAVVVGAIAAEVGQVSGLPANPRSYDTTALSQVLFGMYGPWLLLLGLVMMAALSGAIYLVREGRE